MRGRSAMWWVGFAMSALVVLFLLMDAGGKLAAVRPVLEAGYLGGAVATHVRLGNPLFTHVLFGVYVGVVMWGGLVLREPKVRALLLAAE